MMSKLTEAHESKPASYNMKFLNHLSGVLLLILVTSCGGGGGNTIGTSSTSFSGTAMDGYLYKATVFLDLNENGTLDAGEPTATTSETGAFTLAATQEQINRYKVVVVAVAGITIDQDSPNTTVTSGFTMMSPAGNHEVVSPLTTQVAAKMNAGLSLADAKIAVQDELGLTSIDLMRNYVSAKATDANYAKAHNIAASIAEVLKTVDADSTSSTKLADKLTSITAKVTTQIKPNIENIKSATSTTNALVVAAIPKGINLISPQFTLSNDSMPIITLSAELSYIDQTRNNISNIAEWVVTTVSDGGTATVEKASSNVALTTMNTGIFDVVAKYRGITSSPLRVTYTCGSGHPVVNGLRERAYNNAKYEKKQSTEKYALLETESVTKKKGKEQATTVASNKQQVNTKKSLVHIQSEYVVSIQTSQIAGPPPQGPPGQQKVSPGQPGGPPPQGGAGQQQAGPLAGQAPGSPSTGASQTGPPPGPNSSEIWCSVTFL